MLPLTAYIYFFITFYVFGTDISRSHFIVYLLISLLALSTCYYYFRAKIVPVNPKTSVATKASIKLPLFIKALVIYFLVLRSYEISSYGLDAFSGTADAINIYGAEDYYLGFKQIANAVISFFVTACLIKYSMESYYSGSKCFSIYHYTYFLIMPLLYASRGGVLVFIYIYMLFKRIRFVNFIPYALVFVLIAAIFGENRIYFMQDKDYESPPILEMVFKHITGESTVSQAYDLIVSQATTEIGVQYGKTILAPLVFKIIPRHFMPDKPVNTSAVIMNHYFPDAWSANLSWAPSLLGDLYFNFSFMPTLFFVYFFTVLSCYLWIKFRSLKYEIGSPMSIGCVSFFLYYFTLIRNNLSDSLFTFILSFVTLYLVFHWKRVMASFLNPLPVNRFMSAQKNRK